MFVRFLHLTLLFVLPVCNAQDTEQSGENTTKTVEAVEAEVKVANKVEVAPVNTDEEIEDRLSSIFEATTWFEGIAVRVDGGVAFLTGLSDTETHRDWAEKTAMNTSDVVAVVNRLSVAEKPIWNFAPAVVSLKELARDTTSLLPLIAIAIVLVVVFYFLSVAGARLTRWLVRDRVQSGLLRQVSGNVIGVLIFVIGFYIALRVSGLTRLAVTLLGGTGLIGLALGFAFRDIAENYLASILISLNNPFRVGDLVEIEGQKGYVRKVTTRGTVLNSEDGNQIQIPNSTVYKGTIRNYTATPLTRREFFVGIALNAPVEKAQKLMMDVLTAHTAVMDEPGPTVLVDSLGAATVKLRCQFWLDQEKHAPGKVTSSLIRQVMQELNENGISLPNEARELIFPQGVPVNLIKEEAAKAADTKTRLSQMGMSDRSSNKVVSVESTEAEGDLSSDRAEIERVTEDEGPVADETNLLKPKSR